VEIEDHHILCFIHHEGVQVINPQSVGTVNNRILWLQLCQGGLGDRLQWQLQPLSEPDSSTTVGAPQTRHLHHHFAVCHDAPLT
jgi:hypothetical protein